MKSTIILLLLVSLLVLPTSALYIATDFTGLGAGVFTPRFEDQNDDTSPNTDGLKYYIANTVTNNFSSTCITKIETGIESWNSSSHLIDIEKTTAFNLSRCDIRAYDDEDITNEDFIGIFGYTLLYFGDGAYNGNNTPYYEVDAMPKDQDYGIMEIFINYGVLNTNNYSSSDLYTRLQTTGAHEMGHALGLIHVPGVQYLMYNGYEDGISPTSPTLDEKDEVYQLYNNRVDD